MMQVTVEMTCFIKSNKRKYSKIFIKNKSYVAIRNLKTELSRGASTKLFRGTEKVYT